MRVAVDLRCLLEPFESGVTVYTKAMVNELLLLPDLDLDLFYQARTPCERIHELYPQVRHLARSNSAFHLSSLFRFPRLPLEYFPVKPDLIWLPDRRPFYRTEIPMVLTIHDQVPEKFRSSLSLKGKLWHWIFPLRRLQGMCEGFLFPSLTVAQAVSSKLPWEVTYEGASLSKNMLKPQGVPDEFFLSLAPLDPRKRLDWFFEMAKRFPKVRFVCAGLKNKDERFSKLKLPVLRNVYFLGAVTEPEKKWLLKNAHALISVSAYEGFDLPVLEAVTCKTPVILSDISVHRELYKNASFIGSPDELQAAVYSALQGDGKVPTPRGEYSWEKAAQRASLFFFRVLLHKDRKHSGHRHR